MQKEITGGCIVKIKPEWCNSEEESTYLYIVKKGSVNNGRCMIVPITGPMASFYILPIERVSIDMLIFVSNEKDKLDKA